MFIGQQLSLVIEEYEHIGNRNIPITETRMQLYVHLKAESL